MRPPGILSTIFGVACLALALPGVALGDEEEAAPGGAVIRFFKGFVDKTFEAQIDMEPAPAAEAEAAPEENAAMIEQTVQQLRPLLRTEQLLLVSACQPSPAQLKEIRREGNEALKTVAREVAAWQVKRRQPQNVALKIPEPLKSLQSALSASAKKHLAPEQYERYARELKIRADDQKRVAVLNLAAKLDAALFLSAEQRDKVVTALSKHWSVDWGAVQGFTNDDPYFPPIPDAVFSPILTEPQKKVWDAAIKVNRSNFGLRFGMNPGQVVMDGEEIEILDAQDVAVPIQVD